MKKILTVLFLALVAMGAYADAEERIVFLGSETTGEAWKSGIININKDAFSSLQENDLLCVYVTGFTSTSDNYQQCKPNVSGEAPIYSVKVGDDVVVIKLSSTQVSYITTNGLSVDGRDITITKVSYGIPTDATIVSNSTSLVYDTGEWGTGLSLNVETLKTASAGDEIVVDINDTYTTSERNYTQAFVYLGGSELVGSSDYENYKTIGTRSYILTSENITAINSASTANLVGNGVKVNNVYIRKHSNVIYSLLSNTDYIDLSKVSGSVNAEFRRTFGNYWNTLCLPFAWETSSLTGSPQVYTYDSYDSSESKVKFNVITGTIAAGTPCLINFGESPVSVISASGVTVTSTPNTSAAFKGNFTKDLGMSGMYGLAWKDGEGNGWKFYKGASGSKLPAFAAYFAETPSINAPSRGFSIEVGDGTTGIDAMERVVEEDNGPTYNLMGQQTTTPRKGIYIKNGKKYIAK